MTPLVIYDSQFGNTEKIAQAIGRALGGATKVVRSNEIQKAELQSVDLLVVGSPTQGGRATLAIQNLVDSIQADELKNVKVAAFDTRFMEKDQNMAIRFLIKTIGYAAEKIAKTLKTKGGQLVVPPEPFFVNGKEGPLKDGELERAAEWGKSIVRGF